MLDMLTPRPTPRELRPYQADALLALRQSVAQGVRRIVVHAPTGAGKSRIAAEIVNGARRKGNRAAFVVPAISLVDQTVEMFENEGIDDIGVIQASHLMTDWSRPVQVCSIQTLRSRGAFPEADVVIFDECHALHEHHRLWLGHPDWQHVPMIGLSATPYSRGLGKHFHTMLVAATTQQLIDDGWLSPFRTFAPAEPDMSKVRTVAGDYHEGDLGDAMNLPPLVADIVSTWQERWGQGKTLCFCVDRAHARAVADQFLDAGICAAYQDAHTDESERRAIRRRFHSGEVKVVCNIGTLTTGVDWDVRCIILARPTKSEILHVQIIGRGLRTAEGKENCLILDHAGNTLRLGYVTDIQHERLDDGTGRKPEQRDTDRKAPLPKKCPACTALRPPRMTKCPHCGFEVVRASNVETVDGELVELDPKNRKNAKKGGKREFTSDEKFHLFGQLKRYCARHGYKPGWAANQFRERVGTWPNGYGSAPEEEPSEELLRWLKSRQIRWAKRKREEVARAPAAA